MFTDAAKNLMLDAFGITHASLHSAYPGLSGSSELSGGSPPYARKPITFGAAAAGSKSASNAPLFDVPAGNTAAWIGFWTAATGGSFLGAVPNGGQERKFRIDVIANVVESAAHGIVNGSEVVFFNGTTPAPLAGGTPYFVVNATADTMQVSSTVGGAPIDLTSPGTYDCIFSKIVRESFGAQGQHSIDSLALNLNG